MRPMLPFVPPKPPRPRLPFYLKALLALKAAACVLVLFLCFTTLAVLNAKVDPMSMGDDGRRAMHALGQILMLLVVVELLQLLGIVGTWSMKRWGVYLLAFFAMLDVVLNLRAHSPVAITLGLATTIIVGSGIVVRWKDFE